MPSCRATLMSWIQVTIVPPASVAAGHVVVLDVDHAEVRAAKTGQVAQRAAALKYRVAIAGALAPETRIA